MRLGKLETRYIFEVELMNQIDQPIVVENIKKGSSSVRIFVSTLEKPLIFPISKLEFLELEEGQEMTPEQLRQIREESEIFECEAKTASLLANRDYSIGDLKRKLKFKKFGVQAIREAVHKYQTKGILDDKKYAAKVAGRLIREKPSGKHFLIAALQKKLIPRDLAEETVESIFQNEDIIALAVEALSKRWRQFGQFELEAARTKSYNYLSRRGFSYSAAKEAFTKLWEEQFGVDENEVRIY